MNASAETVNRRLSEANHIRVLYSPLVVGEYEHPLAVSKLLDWLREEAQQDLSDTEWEWAVSYARSHLDALTRSQPRESELPPQ